MRTAVSILVVLTSAVAIQVPAASSYIYRSDNGGPASFIQLGAPGYQPQAFAAPIPLAPVKALEAYDLAAVPLPYVAANPIAVEDAEDDYLSYEEEDDDDVDDGYLSHGHEFEEGGGSEHQKGHHQAEGGKGLKSYKSKEYLEKGESGHYAKEHEKGHYGEAKGLKGAHFDEAEEKGKNHHGGGNYKGGNHGHKSHHTKGEEVKGYHKEFNKDEYKKDADFYDVAEKTGHSKKFSYDNKHEETYDGEREKGNKGDSAYVKLGHGRAGHHNKGHKEEADESHAAREGEEIQYRGEKERGEKGGKEHSKEYVYSNEEREED